MASLVLPAWKLETVFQDTTLEGFVLEGFICSFQWKAVTERLFHIDKVSTEDGELTFELRQSLIFM